MCVNSTHFIYRLNYALNNKALPGEKAQLKMSPKNRVLFPKKKGRPHPSAVLLSLYNENGIWNLVMIKRAEYKGVHSGQIAFPGGKKESFDDSLLQTAIRESQEEVGIHSNDVQIVGKLSPLYIPVSNMCVHPYVGFFKTKPIFIKHEKEVQKILSIPIPIFFKKETTQSAIFKGENYQVEAPCYVINEDKIWGASAMILSEFIYIITNLKND